MKEDFSKKQLIFEINNWDEEEYKNFKEDVVEYVKKHYNDVHISEKLDIQYLD